MTTLASLALSAESLASRHAPATGVPPLQKTLAELEADISEYCHCTHAVGCASGSDAILLPLQGLDIGHGDLVVCPSYTFFSTAGSIHRLGATPVFCDVDPASYNMTSETLERAFDRPDSDRIKAIIPVHLFGQCCDMDGTLPTYCAALVNR